MNSKYITNDSYKMTVENGVLKTPDNIRQIYIGKDVGTTVNVSDTSKKLI